MALRLVKLACRAVPNVGSQILTQLPHVKVVQPIVGLVETNMENAIVSPVEDLFVHSNWDHQPVSSVMIDKV